MTHTKDTIEEIWWVIPPLFILFVFFPLFLIWDDGTFSLDKYVFWLQYLFTSSIGIIYTIFTFGFMGIGYYLTSDKPLMSRIAVPTILSIIGFIVGLFMALFIAGAEI